MHKQVLGFVVALSMAWCSVSAAEDKPKPGKLPMGFGKSHAVNTAVPAKTMAALKEKSRAIDVGGSGSSGIKDIAALGQVLEDMGLEPQAVEGQDAYIVKVEVQGLNPVPVFIAMDDTFVYSSVWIGTVRDPAAASPEAVLALTEYGGPMGAYAYNSQNRGLLTFAAVEKSASRSSLLKRIRGVALLVGSTIQFYEKIGFEQ